MNHVCPNCGSQRGTAENAMCPDCGRPMRPDDWMWMREPVAPAPRAERRGFLAHVAGARRAWMLVSLVFAAAAIAGGVYSLRTYRDGAKWKDRAETLEARTNSLETRVRDSEADVERLQARIDALANEKAAAEDERVVAQQERDVAVEIAGLATSAVVDSRVCLDALGAALSDIIDFYDSGFGSPNASLSYAQNVCDTADASFNDFAAAVDRLG